MRYTKWWCVVALVASGVWTASSTTASAAEYTIFVSPQGDDNHAGTVDAPVKSLQGAQQLLRARKQQDAATAVNITVAGGNYYLAEPVAFTAEDTGTAAAPIVIKAADDARVRMIAGRSVDAWSPVKDEAIRARLTTTAAAHVLEADLQALGITDYGQLVARGNEHERHPAGLEVSYAGRPAQLARWPNTDWATVKATLAHDRQRIEFTAQLPLRPWQTTADAWAHGFWQSDWSDAWQPIKKVDFTRGVMSIERSAGAETVRESARFCVLNVLEELDSPGEWYLDRTAGRLYFWPPAPMKSGDVVVSLHPHALSFYDVSHFTVRGLTIEGARVCAVEVVRGENVVIEQCHLHNTGNLAAHIFAGRHHRVTGCEIHDTGEGALRIEGGDRATLTPCHHQVDNNHIHHYGRTCLAWHPAIDVHGVGVRVANNLIHDGPDGAVHLNGNDHVVEGNEVHTVCLETVDVGAIYLGHDWTEQGNIIRDNYLHHLGRFNRRDVMGIYLDDFASGTVVTGNVLRDAGRAVVIGGGRDNRVENNLFIDGAAGVQVDSRGLTWASAQVNQPTAPLPRRLAAVASGSELYIQRYPRLAKLLQDEPAIAKGNQISRNIFACAIPVDLHDAATHAAVACTHNWEGSDPHFVDRAHNDFRLRVDSPALSIGFQPIQWEKIGLVSSRISELATVREVDVD